MVSSVMVNWHQSEDAKAMVATGIDFHPRSYPENWRGIGNIHGPYPENWSGLHLDHLQKLTEAVPNFPNNRIARWISIPDAY